MNFPSAQSYLLGLINEHASRRSPNRLDRIRAFVDELDRPQLRYPTVHVAGTSGKGSTATMIAAAFTAAGKRVGTAHEAASPVGHGTDPHRRFADRGGRVRGVAHRNDAGDRRGRRGTRPADLLRDALGDGVRRVRPSERRRCGDRSGDWRTARRHQRSRAARCRHHQRLARSHRRAGRNHQRDRARQGGDRKTGNSTRFRRAGCRGRATRSNWRAAKRVRRSCRLPTR